jgi:hypothetical protein
MIILVFMANSLDKILFFIVIISAVRINIVIGYRSKPRMVTLSEMIFKDLGGWKYPGLQRYGNPAGADLNVCFLVHTLDFTFRDITVFENGVYAAAIPGKQVAEGDTGAVDGESGSEGLSEGEQEDGGDSSGGSSVNLLALSGLCAILVAIGLLGALIFFLLRQQRGAA